MSDLSEALQLVDDAVVYEIETGMHFAMQGVVAKLVAAKRLPEQFPTYLIVAQLALLGRTLGATMIEEEREDMYQFIQRDGMLIIDGSMRHTIAKLEAERAAPEEQAE